MRKILSAFIVVVYIFSNILSIATALTTDERASPWTREKATHLARITLFNADTQVIDSLFAAGSATAAINMIFPDQTGPDRTAFNAAIMNYTASGFNWGDANHTTRLYQLVYAADPYESKRKLFSLFEDIFAVNRDTDRDITYKDVYDLHTLLYSNMLGNYQSLVKKVLNNNGTPGDYAQGRFLDLFNQKDPTRPNENFARELLQLFLMGEYEPYESKDNNDIRNYEESDVVAFAKILTGLKADPMTHIVSFDVSNHYSGAVLKFLSGGLSGMNPPYYDSASGTIDPMAILTPLNGNNGLTDNAVEYVFAKRSDQIALFLADRIARFYMSDKPTRAELDFIAQIIKNNNFDILPSIKAILVLDIVYSNASMNTIRYKNPLELNIGTIRFLRNNNLTGIVADPNVYDTNLLRRLGWTPYFPGSVFGRDGFDNSLKWSSTSNQGAWMSASNYFTYRSTGTGALDFLTMLGSQKKEITTGSVNVMTHIDNSYTGSLTVLSGTLNLGNPIPGVSVASMVSSKIGLLSVDDAEPKYVYPLDPIESILGGENLDLFSSIDQWISDDVFLPQKTVEISEITEIQNIENSEIQKPIPMATGSATVITGSEDKKRDLPIDMPTDTGATTLPDVSIEITGSITPESITGTISLTGTVISEMGTSIIAGSEVSVETGEKQPPSVSIEIVPPLDTNTGSIEPIATGSVQTGAIVDSGTTTSGSVLIVPVDSGSTDTSAINTGSITETKGVDISEKNEVSLLASTVTISTGSVTLPLFKVVTGLGTITVSSGTYNGDTRTLLIHSGVIVSGGSGTEVLSGSSIVFDMNSKLIADTIQPDEIIDIYESYIYGEKRLQGDVKILLKEFITKNSSGATIPIAPTNTNYFNKYMRGLLSILLSQPEYVLLSGYDLPTTTSSTDQHFLDGVTGKLFFVELYGGNDHMTGIIPKDEYSTYLDYRSNQTGSIAITGTGLVDIGDFYMNSALAFGSGGGPGFKSLLDQGYLKIFNRVGGYKHSNDHDAAAKQITSYDNSTAMSAEGVFGHLVKSEFESSHTISLGSKLPNIYRSGHFVNLGGNVILSNPLDQSGQLKSHMDTMVKITLVRTFPSNTRDLFKDAGRISEIGKTSVAQGGPSGANGDMNNVFKFAKVLMTNNIGRSFYMGGYGGYDTHGNQFTGLNKNLNFVSTAVTNFFNEVKDTQDVTIVIFSEFGRTNKTNGDLGTDHGDGGGMYVITSNQALRNTLQAGTYGNMSIKNAKRNSLGIGIDYRSVFGAVFNGLYNLDPSTYFGTGIDLSRDIGIDPNKISLLNYSYRASGQSPILTVNFIVSGNNYNPGKAGYTRLLSGTGQLNPKIITLNEKGVPGGFQYNFDISPSSQPIFSIESLSNQYTISGFSGTLTGATRPLVLANGIREISQIKSSVLSTFDQAQAPTILAGSGIILENTGGKMLTIASNNEINIQFASGRTNVTDLTTVSGSIAWRGGFILGEKIDKNLFIPSNALIVPDNTTLPLQNVTHLFKIGADVRGVGMILNQPVGIEFVGLPVGEKYRALSSQDGIMWTDVEGSGQVYQAGSTGSILVHTNHFSFFALASTNVVVSPPTCTITANPTSILNGGTSLLSWTMTNSLTGTLSPGNTILGASGSLLVTPPSNAITPYTLVVTNSAGTNSCTASITASSVVIVPPTTPPTCTITANPTSILNGGTSLLSWTMTNSLTGTLSPGNTILGASGSLLVTPPSNATTPYTMVVVNSAGTSSCVTAVTASSVVVPPVVPPVNPPSGGNGGGITGPGGGGGGGSPAIRLIDTCLGGDTSGNYYDGTCSSTPIRTPQNRPVSGNNPVTINTLSVSNTLSALITDLESENGDTLTRSQEQRVYALSLDIWREITKRKDINVESATSMINSLKDLRNKTSKTRTHRALDTIVGIFEQFMELGGFDNAHIATVQPIDSVASIQDDPESTISSTYKYVNAERAVTFRKSASVGISNILGYLTRNTQIRVIAEGLNGWTRVLSDGVEGYIKSSYLRDANAADILRNGGTLSGYLPKGHINVARSAYVRNSPDLGARISSVVYRDNIVTILDSISGWYEVLLGNGSRGYIRREVVNTMDTTI